MGQLLARWFGRRQQPAKNRFVVLTGPTIANATPSFQPRSQTIFKVGVFGDDGAGKTSLIHRLSTGQPLEEESQESFNHAPIPVEKFLGNIRRLVNEELRICAEDFEALVVQNAKVKLFDDSCDDKEECRKEIAREADVVIWCVDPECMAKTNTVDGFLDSIKAVVHAMMRPRLLLVLTKSDHLRTMKTKQVENIKKKFDAYYSCIMPCGPRRGQVSCTTGEGFEELEGELMLQLKDATGLMHKMQGSEDLVIKAITLGPPNVGKTTFCQLAAYGKFSAAGTRPTIGQDYFSFNVPNDERKVVVHMIDTAGLERSGVLPMQYHRGARVVFAVWDMSRPETLDETREAIRCINWSQSTCIVYVGMKRDIADIQHERVKAARGMRRWVYDRTEGSRVQDHCMELFSSGL
eukprot:TRINITY_DN16875_c0_g1_i1.p1 TRINITY_DN16875_c0_g1~~TRINITY_DN16875_c0_g1_i1.p1  ORF type:complete len:407 (-),score=75.52 TRINITY_DN16875_c0_g1_i1:554-1774(-)